MFTLADSTSAFGGGLFLVIWSFVFTRSRVGTTTLEDGTEAFLAPIDAAFLTVLSSVLLICVLIQFCDMNLHRVDLGWPPLLVPRPEVVGILGYSLTASIPLVLCLSTAAALEWDGGISWLLIITAIIVVLHQVGSMSFDYPVNGWANASVVNTKFMNRPIRAIVYSSFGTRDDIEGVRFFSGSSRAFVFFVTLFIGTVVYLFRSLDYLWRPRSDCESDSEWCQTIGYATGGGMIACWAALGVAAWIASSGSVTNHLVSLWSRAAIVLGGLVHGLILLRHQSLGLIGLYLGIGFAIWFVLYAVTSALVEPRDRKDDAKAGMPRS